MICNYCDKEFIPKYVNNPPFCNPVCRNKLYIETVQVNLRTLDIKTIPTRKRYKLRRTVIEKILTFNPILCKQCGQSFIPDRSWQRFCKDSCRSNHHYELHFKSKKDGTT